MVGFIRAYLRASTTEQNAERARNELDRFATERGHRVAAYYIEHESGASLKRPELFRLLRDAGEGDIVLVEQVDRLSRLDGSDWEALKAEIRAKGIHVVALDLPTSWAALDAGNTDELTNRMLKAMNDMMLDMLAAIARKDYEDRRRRQQQGIQKAKEEGKFTGRKKDQDKRERVARLLDAGFSWGDITRITSASRSTVARVNRDKKATEKWGKEGVPAEAR